MKIIPISYNNYNQNNKAPNFEAYSTRVLKEDGKLAYRTLSNFYRADLVWPKLIDYIINKYKDVDKVNVVSHACSVGYEPYSFLILLMNILGEENCEKYLPVQARDIDENVIEYAKIGKLEATYGEYAMASHYGGVFESHYYNKDMFYEWCKVSRIKKPAIYDDLKDDGCNPNEILISFYKKLKNCINFQQSDIFNDKDLISKDNTVLLFRNVWPYLGDEGIDKLADFLAANMKKSSLLVIGGFDITKHVDKKLIGKGFKDTLYHKFCEHQMFEPPT